MRSLFCVCLLLVACGPDVSVLPDAARGSLADARQKPDASELPVVDAQVPTAQMYVHTANQLFLIDDSAFDLTLIGAFGLAAEEGGMTDLAVAANGTLYGITKTKLYTVSAQSGSATYVADVPGLSNVGMTFLPDGNLLATDQDGGVRRIDPSTGDVTEIGTFGGGYATAGDLVAVANGTMYAISDEGPNGDEAQNNVLLTVDTDTGLATPVGQIGYGGVFGCAVASGNVYAFTRDGEVIEIEPSTGAGVLKRTHSEHSFWGAGVTPLVVVD